MTRDELASLAKDLLFENAATTGIGTDTEIAAHIDRANRKVWRLVTKNQPSLYVERADEVPFQGSLGYVDLSGIDPRGVHLLSGVYVKAADYFASGDPYLALEPLQESERQRFGNGSYGGTYYPRGYYLEGEYLYLVPRAEKDATLQIAFIPKLPEMAADTEALGGKLEEFHDLVAYEAALVLGVKDEASLIGLKLLRDEARRDLLLHLARGRQRQRPKFIREVPFG